MALTGNGIELLVKLGVATSESKANLNKEIEALQKQLNEVKIDIKIDPQAIKSLNQLATMDFSKLVQSANEVKKGLDGVGKKAGEETAIVKKKIAEVAPSIDQAFNGISKNLTKEIKQGITSIEGLKKAFKGVDATFNIDYKRVGDGAKTIDGLTVSYKNLQGQIEKVKMSNKAFIDMGGGRSENIWLPEDKSKAIDNTLKSIASQSASAKQQIEKLRIEGKITEEQFKKLNLQINSAGRTQSGKQATDSFREMNLKILQAVESTKKLTAAQRETEAAQKRLIDNENKRKNLIIDIERALRTQGKGYDMAGAQNLLRSTQQLNSSSATFGQTLAANRTQFRQFNADAAQANNNSMSVIDSFKVAMEKFPIWLAASTLFFGVTRTAREFGSIIVDIDSKMTNMTKVMSESEDFGAIFDNATASAERFGQSISQVLDAYTEFAKQGFKGNELEGLANSGLVASNVGDITAQKASEYMTASLIQWKMDAQDSMKIIDSLV